jgi:hypothetical protein
VIFGVLEGFYIGKVVILRSLNRKMSILYKNCVFYIGNCVFYIGKRGNYIGNRV